jgi:hypothetical protein
MAGATAVARLRATGARRSCIQTLLVGLVFLRVRWVCFPVLLPETQGSLAEARLTLG